MKVVTSYGDQFYDKAHKSKDPQRIRIYESVENPGMACICEQIHRLNVAVLATLHITFEEPNIGSIYIHSTEQDRVQMAIALGTIPGKGFEVDVRVRDPDMVDSDIMLRSAEETEEFYHIQAK